jgi:hypothetical protein
MWFWQTKGRSAERVILGVRPGEFILLEFQSPSRRIFIGSHSLPPLWSPNRSFTHTVKEVNMLHAKMDLLMKRMGTLTSEKAAMAITTQAMDARMTCEVSGDTRHPGNYCPATHKDVMYMNENNGGYRTQAGQTWNQSRPYYQGAIKVNTYNPNQPSRKICFWAS